ncbi:MAG: M23 family peptidase [Sulfurospirillum sp.]|nr:MAG: M23 family peptidase [Sulfurospirillum sp.]
MQKGNQKAKYLLLGVTLLALTLVFAAIFSLYFSSETVQAKKEELLLEQNYLRLRQQIADKEREYRAISDNIAELKDEVGLNTTKNLQNSDALLQKTTPLIRSMILQNLPSGYPCSSRRITSRFGWRMHPIYHEKRFHHGIDFGGMEGTPIRATCNGIVEFAGYSKGGYGNMVIIDHNYGFKTLFGHMLKNLRVKKGDFVKKGSIIGYLGNTGLSTGPHLHYEIKYLRYFIDPYPFLQSGESRFATILKETPQIRWQQLISAITTGYEKFRAL